MIPCEQTQLPLGSCVQGPRWVTILNRPVSLCYSSFQSLHLHPSWMDGSFFLSAVLSRQGSSAEPPGFPSLLLHLIFFYSTSPQIYHLAPFSPKSVGKGGELFLGPDRGGPLRVGAGRARWWWGVAMEGRKGSGCLRRGSEKCDSCKRCRGEKKGRMSIIDSDDPSRMAVFPGGGGRRWADPSQSHRCGGRDRGMRQRWRCGYYTHSLSHTMNESTHLPCHPTHPLPIMCNQTSPPSPTQSLVNSAVHYICTS